MSRRERRFFCLDMHALKMKFIKIDFKFIAKPLPAASTLQDWRVRICVNSESWLSMKKIFSSFEMPALSIFSFTIKNGSSKRIIRSNCFMLDLSCNRPARNQIIKMEAKMRNANCNLLDFIFVRSEWNWKEFWCYTVTLEIKRSNSEDFSCGE